MNPYTIVLFGAAVILMGDRVQKLVDREPHGRVGTFVATDTEGHTRQVLEEDKTLFSPVPRPDLLLGNSTGWRLIVAG